MNPTHYGNPKTGCESDEQAVRVQGLSGDFCSPKCNSQGSCPSDVPKGDSATPQCALRTTTGDKYCALICQSDSDCGTGSCQKIMGVGLCTYDASNKTHVEAMMSQVAVATNPTHYGNPKTGCESDEEAVRVQGLSGDFCSPKCNSQGSCPSDVPKGDSATPQCALRTTTGDKYCALICQSDSDCDVKHVVFDFCQASCVVCIFQPATAGTGSCQKIMGVGLCTYDASNKTHVEAMMSQVAVATNPTHYGNPKTGCESDEEAVRVQGLSGDFCSPKCNSQGSCPSDVPKGDSATPQCALRTTTGDKYCALICQSDSDCGTGSCQKIMGVGLCTYDASNKTHVETMMSQVAVATNPTHYGNPKTGCESDEEAVRVQGLSFKDFGGCGMLHVFCATPLLQVAVATNPTHYGNPETGCESDEQAVRVQGLSGDFCSPKCNSQGSCPSDVPKGDSATPQCALRTTTGDKYCALICQSDSDCGTGSCQKIMGVAVATNPTHYGNPKTGCESDEEAVRVQGLSGDFCSPKCNSQGSCPSDVPKGDSATPQCALRTTTGDKYCALICQSDSDCGTGSCQKIMGVAVATNPTHYGNPKTGCESDEQAVRVQGLSGDFCSPKCNSQGSCPSDVPKGDSATPQCALRTTTGDKYCALICQSDSDCGTGSCQKIMGVGLCTYDASNEALVETMMSQVAVATNPTHYGNPKTGCESDEEAVRVQGLSGDFCSPKCNSQGSCPSDVPKGDSATPQCALRTTTGDKYCALICQSDSDCGTGSCQKIMGVGLCTYDATAFAAAAALQLLPAEVQMVI
eukprot:symbB.v1.2.017841.t2/scaffold1399.1/size121348/4